MLVDRYGAVLAEPLVLGGRAHPFSAMSAVCRARVLAFRGDIAAADAELRALRTVPSGRVGAVVSGTVALVRGNDSDPAEVRRAVAAVDREVPAPDDLLSCGAHLLAAFGEIALNEVVAAARRVLVAGGDEGLTRLNASDRALGLEILVALAVAEGDLDAAEAWADRVPRCWPRRSPTPPPRGRSAGWRCSPAATTRPWPGASAPWPAPGRPTG